MSLAYFDTSVLVKNYVREAGSARARSLLRTYSFLSSAIAPLELMSALMRKRSTGELNVLELPRVLARIQTDRLYWKLLDIGASVLSQGEELIQKTSLRTTDAIHLAVGLTPEGLKETERLFEKLFSKDSTARP